MIKRLTNDFIIAGSGGQAYSFEIMGKDRADIEQISQPKHRTDWEDYPLQLGNFMVIPFGEHNDIPEEIRDTTSSHNLAPRVLTKRKFLTWGSGPILYRIEFTEGKPAIKYVEDPEINAWLESWDYKHYLLAAIDDYNHSEGHFTKIIRSKAHRIGASKIAKLEHLSIRDTRLAYRYNPRPQPPTHAIFGRWKIAQTPQDFKVYPLFSKFDPFRHAHSVHYAKMNAFGQDNYPMPDIMGTLDWMKRSASIPRILEFFTKNSLNMRWHIISPQAYWEAQEDMLKEKCRNQNTPYTRKMLEDLKDEIFQRLSQVLAGEENVGKFFESEKSVQILGNSVYEHKWEIIPIEQKIKEFVETQIEISKRSDYATTAGLGLHSALSNIGTEGRSDSGSEQLYAYKNYQLSEVHLPEMIITEAVNMAIAINWPSKGLKLGFYRQLPEREEDITASKRVKDGDTI